jgi:hypothetical protein
MGLLNNRKKIASNKTVNKKIINLAGIAVIKLTLETLNKNLKQ